MLGPVPETFHCPASAFLQQLNQNTCAVLLFIGKLLGLFGSRDGVMRSIFSGRWCTLAGGHCSHQLNLKLVFAFAAPEPHLMDPLDDCACHEKATVFFVQMCATVLGG